MKTLTFLLTNAHFSVRGAVLALSAIMLVASGCEHEVAGEGGAPDPQSPGSNISTFSKSYGGPLNDEAHVVLNTGDGGFMLLGTADGHDLDVNDRPDGADFWLQKLDTNGNVEVNRLVGNIRLRNDTDWRRARPLPDGGAVLTGVHKVTETVSRASGPDEELTVGNDVAVARLGPTGAVEWSLSYDSGAWLNYDYFPANGERAAANDQGLDVWPASDGGYYVAALSTANLEDTRRIGFPCLDEEVNDLGEEDCEQPLGVGSRYMGAFSIVILRLNADGGLRWVTRLTDNAFVANRNFNERGTRLDRNRAVVKQQGVLIREAADGDVVLARSVEGGLLVHRLGADGSRLWRAAVEGMSGATALIQTDDPVDNGDQDGERDDGFAIVGGDHVVKLNADGEVEWNTDISNNNIVNLNDAIQFCDSGTPTRCFVVPVGTAVSDGTHRGTAWMVDEDGDVRATVQNTDPSGQSIRDLTRIAPGTPNRFEVLGLDEDGRHIRMLIALAIPSSIPLLFRNYRAGTARGISEDHLEQPLPELRPDGGILALTAVRTRLQFFDSQVVLQTEVELANVGGAEVLQAAAQIGPGHFVLAGMQRLPFDPERGAGVTQAIAMRYDLDTNGERLVWQRALAPDLDAEVRAIAATSDGGVVISLIIPMLESVRGHLIKLNAAGEQHWSAALESPARALQPTPDGGVAALSSNLVVSRFSSSGSLLWQRRPSLSVETITSTNDGGLLLAGLLANASISVVKLGSDGVLVSAQEIHLRPLSPTAIFADLRVRETPDGGVVLAMTETGLLTSLVAGAALPLGQDNAFVLKLDAQYRPLWGRVYGAQFAESVRDLALRDDGTIAIAGYSESLGDRREAWLLKLSSEGLIAGSGCQALLASLPVELAGTEQPSVTVVDVTQAVPDAPELSEPEEMGYSMRAPEDFVTARQCLGNATTTPAAPVSTWRLTVQQAEGRRGVVTSTPSGISCGTGLDICAADFPRGSRVTLRAEDPSRFLNWGSTCDENTGGEQPTCVVLLNADRTVQADFRPRAPTGRFTLSIEIQGPGSVQAGQINCREDNLPENCAQEFGQGALIEIGAFPTQDWLGSGEDASFLGWSGDPECTALGTRRSGLITLDRNVHCIAQFRAPNLHLIRISVFGGGVVSDDPPRPSGSAAFECREGQVGGGCQARFPSTTMVPLRATPNFGQRFVGWGGDCASLGSNPRINVEVADNMNCTATFEQATTPQRLNVIYSRGAPNRIIESTPAGIRCFDGSGSDCEELYVPGTDVVLRANFPGTVWSGCDSLFTDTNGITACHMLMDQSPRTAHATFPPF